MFVYLVDYKGIVYYKYILTQLYFLKIIYSFTCVLIKVMSKK